MCHEHPFPEQEVNINVAHLGPANNMSKRLNGLLSLISVTAGVGVCPIPAQYSTHQRRQQKAGRKGQTWRRQAMRQLW